MRAKAGNAIRDSRIDALESAQRFDQKLIEACHHAMTVLGEKSKAYAELIVSLQAEVANLKAVADQSKAEVERLKKLGTEMGKHLPDTDEANRAYINFEAGGQP